MSTPTTKRIQLASGAKNYFISTWKTDNTSTGSSNDNQVKLPLESSGTYNFSVNWGDGNIDKITAYNQAEVTHTYSVSGTYDINIYGVCKGFCFNNTGDKLKLINIQKWGNNFELGNSTSQLNGCTNLVVSANNFLQNTITNNLGWAFLDCSSLTAVKINTSNVTKTNSLFNGCINFNTVINFNTTLVTRMDYMFSSCSIFNQVINFNSPNVTNMAYMFYKCYLLNSPISLITNNVTNMAYMFFNCTNFNQDISNFNIEKVTTMQNMLVGATSWSRANYDSALISWGNQNVRDSVTFNCSSNFTLGGDAEAARSHLITNHGWTITDLGGV